MPRIYSGISQVGGKFRLIKRLLKLTPPHNFFLSLFCGACWYELNKPRCQYECFNDANYEIINYLTVIEREAEQFEKTKEGIFGLVSEKTYKDISTGRLLPKNDMERAVFFQYLNKLAFAGNATKATFRGSTPMGGFNVEKKATGYKGLQVKTTRPYTNNDNGLLTPIMPEAIKRLRYVNISNKDFRKVYNVFHKAAFIKKGLTSEVFMFADPPYPSTEKYYGDLFQEEDHKDLIEILLNTPFNVMLTIGSKCESYIETFEANEWKIIPVKVKYSTDANTQVDSQEYIIMNYDVKKVGNMTKEFIPTIENYF